MTEQGRKRLADEVQQRRGELRESQDEYARAAGITPKQLQRIEAAKVINPRAGTLAGLDEASRGWPSGTARALLEGRIMTAPSVSTIRYPGDPERQRIWDELSTKELVGREVNDEKRAELVEEIMAIMDRRRGYGGSTAAGS